LGNEVAGGGCEAWMDEFYCLGIKALFLQKMYLFDTVLLCSLMQGLFFHSATQAGNVTESAQEL
jgi:hypothetical protein